MARNAMAVVLLMVGVLFLQAAEPDRAEGEGILNLCNCTATANSGVVLVCPQGDGDPLTNAAGGVNSQITVTLRDATNTPVPNVPVTDVWLVGCNSGLQLCQGSQGSSPDAASDANGVTTFSNEPMAGGCDTGLYVVVMGQIINEWCGLICVPVATRSPDYKSSGAPGPAPCGGDLQCPDGRVSSADFAWFATHYPSIANPGAPYIACADYAAPLGGGQLTLADFSKFAVHFAGTGHKCPV